MAAQDSNNRPKRGIETASGTTSPDNQSGSMPYVICGVTLALLVVLGMGMRGCVLAATDMVEYLVATEGEQYLFDEDVDGEYQDFWQDLPFDFEDDDLPWDEGDEGLDTDVLTDGGQGAMTAPDALGSGLALCETSVDDRLAASAYANAQSSVASSVRALVVIDKESTAQLVDQLRKVAWGQAELSSSKAVLLELVEETSEAVRAVELPAVEGEHAQEVSLSLEQGKSALLTRWEAIADELAYLAEAEDGSVDVGRLSSLDGAVEEATGSCADSFSQALSASSVL